MAKKVFNTIKKIIFSLTIVAILIIIGINTYMKLNEEDYTPNILGYSLLIENSDSMSNYIKTGDLIIVKKIKSEELKVGDIISYRNNDSEIIKLSDSTSPIITHRISKVITANDKYFYETKGDANSAKDLGLVTKSNIIGVMVLRIPRVGKIFKFLKKNLFVSFLIIIAIILAYEIAKKNH